MSLSRHQVKGQRRVIFFDAAGTMFHLARPVGETYATFARQFGGKTTPTLMDDAFRSAWREQVPRQPIAGPRKDDDRLWWKSLALNALHAGAKIPTNFAKEAWFEAIYHHYAQADAWTLYDDVIPALNRLRGGNRLAVISNFDGRLRGILDGLGLGGYFEHIFISSEIGADKPHREIFEHACRIMDTTSECWHVGDDPHRDWAGATAAGLIPFKLKRPELTLADIPT